jgi:outer membrane protein insertion porin family
VEVTSGRRPLLIGGGYSSVDSFVGTSTSPRTTSSGAAGSSALRIRAGAETQQGQISFTEPWLFDRPLAAGFDLFSTDAELRRVPVRHVGGNLRLSHPFLEYWRWNASYRLTRDKISDVVSTDELLKEQEGSRITSALIMA